MRTRRARSLLVLLPAVLLLTVAAPPARGDGAFAWPAPVAGGENPLLGTPYWANGRNATPDALMRLRFARGRTLTHAFGGRPLLRGRLSDRAGRPIVGAVVIIAREVADRPGWAAVRRVRTSGRGRFRARVSPGYVSRRFGALYWPSAEPPALVFSNRVLARVAPRVTLRASALGRGLVRLRGRVRGSRVPPGGLLVSLQVRNRAQWVGVRLVHTDRAGRFSGRYRFAVRGRRFTVRAQVPRQTGWRLAAGRSPRARVRVR